MKSLSTKLLLTGSLVLVSVAAEALPTWQCQTSNARGQTFIGLGPTRAIAAGTGIKFCVQNSEVAANCVIRYCSPTQTPPPPTPVPPVYRGGWQCQSGDGTGQKWIGISSTRARAAGYAIDFCVKHTPVARNCVINYCAPRPTPLVGNWQCNVANERNQLWFGTSATRDGALANAMSYCAANSVNPRNCVLKVCFHKM